MQTGQCVWSHSADWSHLMDLLTWTEGCWKTVTWLQLFCCCRLVSPPVWPRRSSSGMSLLTVWVNYLGSQALRNKANQSETEYCGFYENRVYLLEQYDCAHCCSKRTIQWQGERVECIHTDFSWKIHERPTMVSEHFFFFCVHEIT